MKKPTTRTAITKSAIIQLNSKRTTRDEQGTVIPVNRQEKWWIEK